MEQRHELTEKLQAALKAEADLGGCRGRGLDMAVELAQRAELARRAFYDALNRCTDWGCDLA